MKYKLLVFTVLTSLALGATASNDLTTKPGDPKKEKEKSPSFKLSSGYFNLFNILNTEPAKTDTTGQKAAPATIRQENKISGGQ
jgi:hypothetical protein